MMQPVEKIQEVFSAFRAPNVIIFTDSWELQQPGRSRTSRPRSHPSSVSLAGCREGEVNLQNIAKSFDLVASLKERKAWTLGEFKAKNEIASVLFLHYHMRSSYKMTFQNNPSKSVSPAPHWHNQRRTRGEPACRETATEEPEETILQQEVIALYRIAVINLLQNRLHDGLTLRTHIPKTSFMHSATLHIGEKHLQIQRRHVLRSCFQEVAVVQMGSAVYSSAANCTQLYIFLRCLALLKPL